jgi:rRNA-processing protein FCF1
VSLECRGLNDCGRVALVNTGTSGEAVASAVARLVESVGADTCFLLLTTQASLPHARRAVELLGGLLKGRIRVYVDADVCGSSVYEDVFGNPVAVRDRLEELARSVGFKRIVAVDVTGGVKLEAVLLTSLGYVVLRRKDGDVLLSYTPGEGFARRSPWRRGKAGWWGGCSYPETPRALQPALLLELDSQRLVGAGCKPELVSPPASIEFTVPRGGLEGFQKLMGLMARLFNSITCREASIAMASGAAGRVKVADVDWAAAALNYRRDFGSAAETIAGMVGCESCANCVETLLTMAVSEPAISRSNIEGLTGQRLSDLLAACVRGNGPVARFKGIVVDTNVLYQGLLNSILAAEVQLALTGAPAAVAECKLYTHPCVVDEVSRHAMEEMKSRLGGPANPCAARGLNGLTALAALEKLEAPPVSYCDRGLLEAVEDRQGLLLVTGDTGLANTAEMHGTPYILTHPTRVEAAPTKLWRRHQTLAAALQLTLNLALIASCGQAEVVVEGDHGTARLCNRGLERGAIRISVRTSQG